MLEATEQDGINQEEKSSQEGPLGTWGLPERRAVRGKASQDARVRLSVKVDASITLMKK